MVSPHPGCEVAIWVPFRQYAHSMSILSYSDKYDAYDRLLHCMTIPNVLDAIQRDLVSAPLFPLLRRLAVTITRPKGWLDDLLPHIPSCGTQYLSIEYHAHHSHPEGILDLMSDLSERTPSLRNLRLRLYGRYFPRNAPRIDLFANPQNQSNLQTVLLDCAFLSPLSFSRIGGFPSLRHLTIHLQETTIPDLPWSSLSLDHLVRLDICVTQAKLAIVFFQCIGSIRKVNRVSISISEILPFDEDLNGISHQIHRLCLPSSFSSLEILFKQAPGNNPPPLMPISPGYGLHMFQPLLDFSLRNLNLSMQLPLFPPTPSFVARMALAWINLISIRLDVGCIVPFHGNSAVSICDLIPFFRECERLRQLYIPFQYVESDRLPRRGVQAYALLHLGVGYVNPSSRDALVLALWLGIVAPGLPDIALIDDDGDAVIYSINELANGAITTADIPS